MSITLKASQRGFSLLEAVILVAVLGIFCLAAMSHPVTYECQPGDTQVCSQMQGARCVAWRNC